MNNIDLHIHTQNSDGQHSVKKIINMLIEEQIDIFSITDHDNIQSCIEMEKITLPHSMKYITGIEFSSVLNNIKCHILGYNIDYKNNDIIKQCSIIKQNKHNRILDIMESIKQNFKIEIPEETKRLMIQRVGPVGRTELCMVLQNMGYGSKDEIFNRYLKKVPGNTEHRLNAEDTISAINKSGGKSILAHPKEIEEEYQIYIEDIIEKFLNIGLDGIEVYNSIHTLKDVKRYLQLAQKYNLLTTGGSDYHGEKFKPNINLGKTTTNKIKIKYNKINFKI